MRTADMARAIFIGVILSAATLTPLPLPSYFRWYPMNTVEQSGLMFYFENTAALRATITISGTREGVPFEVTCAIDTDREHGDSFLRFETGNLEQFHLKLMKIELGDRVYTIDDPEAGAQYSLGRS